MSFHTGFVEDKVSMQLCPSLVRVSDSCQILASEQHLQQNRVQSQWGWMWPGITKECRGKVMSELISTTAVAVSHTDMTYLKVTTRIFVVFCPTLLPSWQATSPEPKSNPLPRVNITTAAFRVFLTLRVERRHPTYWWEISQFRIEWPTLTCLGKDWICRVITGLSWVDKLDSTQEFGLTLSSGEYYAKFRGWLHPSKHRIEAWIDWSRYACTLVE